MTILVHRRELNDPGRVTDKNASAIRRETEFSSVLQAERIRQAVGSSSQKYNLPPALILAVIKQESNFNPVAESPCGAGGCMQLMPETAREMGVANRFDIEQNIDGGSRYLKQMLDQFGGDVKLALAAYNAGPARVEQYQGIPPIAETRNYVPSVLAHYESFGGNSGLDSQLLAAQAASLRIAATPSIPMPEIRKSESSDEAPPPPPPSAVRV